jgi:hypothetical protein
MGINPIADPRDRKRLGRLGKTSAERLAKQERDLECKLYDQFISFCRRHLIGYTHADPTRASTIRRGTPDFHLSKNDRSCYGEFKVGSNTLSPDQEREIAWLRECGNTVARILSNIPKGSIPPRDRTAELSSKKQRLRAF